MKKLVILFAIVATLFSCKNQITPIKRVHEFPNYVDTETKEILLQEKKVYVTDKGVSFSNMFEGGKLNTFTVLNDSTYQLSVAPENRPINSSPWYSFKVWSKNPQTVYIKMTYDGDMHRYQPKLSKEGKNWIELSADRFQPSGKDAIFSVDISKDTLWVSAQELFTTSHLKSWMTEVIESKTESKQFLYGKSKLGRDLIGAELFAKKTTKKEVIVLMSRQHPPEVTGQFAFLHFVERLQEEDELTKAFKQKYQVLIFPMQNPDGVDMGHWRHNAGGIDLNRDWDRYNQPETKQMAEFIANYCKEEKLKVVIGLDFHSTWEDIYYTNNSDTATSYPNFTSTWLNEIKKDIPNYEPKIAPSNVGQPVSKGWFFVEHNAVGITYEIGDDTPRDFIEKKSRISAEKMMEVLLKE
ncbi:Zinc carboxypeptidase [Spirosomataceae bacterium TFI 002]|nr:Zinc carboxypeptidase [Spirosomataceae bacterium TFI 002]